jgi:hypothetical protein
VLPSKALKNFFYPEDGNSSEISVAVYQTVQVHIPAGHNCNIQCCENFVSHV